VVLVTGPAQIPLPPDCAVRQVTTAGDMLAAVQAELGSCDVLIMAAAVADWRPRRVSDRKLKKREFDGTLQLERTPDILEAVRPLKGSRIYVGFAAETGEAVAEARRKLVAKGVDLVVANDVTGPGAGFGTDTNRVTLVPSDGQPAELPLMSKAAVAERILQWVEQRAQNGTREGDGGH
jgi:phosphopantothenoylcysteine decarboxylase/phosphopantothenate--cysteine ligase